MSKKFTKEEISWIKYDVANSAYTLTIMTVLFPILWSIVGGNAGISESRIDSIFLYITGTISFVVAILSPILGSMSDFKDYKMKFFKFSLYLGLIFALLLCIPSMPWQVLLVVYSIATICYTASNVFYDAFLIDVTDEENYNTVSSAGYAWGYIGSCVPFILGILVYGAVLFKDKLPFMIYLNEKQAISIAFLIAIIWWYIFSIPMIKNVKQKYFMEKTNDWFKLTFVRIVKTIIKIFKQPKLLLYLLAYFFFIDAVYTIIKSAVQIGNSFPGVTSFSLLGVVFIVQVIAFPCALIFGMLTKKFGEVKMLIYGITVYIIICILGYFLGHVTNNIQADLLIFAGFIGTAQGGIQAVSRSYFGKLIPKNESGEYYGFFNIFGRFASVMGPFIMAITLDLTNSIENNVRFATISLIPLLVIGLIFLLLSTRYDNNNI